MIRIFVLLLAAADLTAAQRPESAVAGQAPIAHSCRRATTGYRPSDGSSTPVC